MGVQIHSEFWSENLKKGYHLEEQGIDERIILKCILKKQGMAIPSACYQ
jgi:hypothetical protein